MREPIIKALQEALAAARGERSCFSRLHPSFDERERGAPKLPTHEDQVDAFVKDRIRLHHETWIIQPLKDVLQALGAPEKEQP